MTAERKAFSLNSEMFSRPIYTVFNDISSFPKFVKHLMLPTVTDTLTWARDCQISDSAGKWMRTMGSSSQPD